MTPVISNLEESDKEVRDSKKFEIAEETIWLLIMKRLEPLSKIGRVDGVSNITQTLFKKGPMV